MGSNLVIKITQSFIFLVYSFISKSGYGIFYLMGWLVFALLSAFFNSLMDLFTKYSSGKIHNGAGSALICFFALLATAFYTLISKFSGQEITVSKEGILFSALAGLTVGIATIFAFKMFATGVNLSIAVPVLRISMILIACFIGITLLREAINWKLIIGLLFSFLGLYLIVSARG